MIALSTDGKAIPRSSRSMLLRNNLLASAAIFFLLEIWRPCFFLTDDNLTGGFPVLTEMGHRLLSGKTPFVSAYLFGGNYPLLSDATFFSWHPIYLLSSLLAGTPAHFLIMEVPAFCFLLLATAGFVNLADYLRKEMTLELSDGWLMFYALSFTYTFMAIATGSSWIAFLGNHSALPWLALGIMQKSFWRGLGLVMLFSLHHILGGHLAPFISVTLFMSLFALGVAFWRQSVIPLISWGLGTALAVLIVLPLALPAIAGFSGSHRSEGLPLEMIQVARIPALVAPGSYFFGTSFWMLRHAPDFHVYRQALAACAAAWCLIPALAGRTQWNRLQILAFGLILATALLIIRPVWITEIMMRLPLLRSLRWPFRELLVFQFFLHLFLVLRPPGWNVKLRRLIAGWSLAVFVIPMIFYAPPSLNPLMQERQLLFSGALDTYWAQVKQHLAPNDRVAVIIPDPIYQGAFQRVCYGLLGSHNFCCLFQFTSASGYSPTPPADRLYLHTPPAYYFGAFTPSQEEALWQERPDLKLMVLESLHPIKITLRSRTGPAIDLTPYVPSNVTYL